MIEDASTFAEGATLSADICIIGSGAAGITLAHQLIGSGRTVIVLEGSAVDGRPRLSADHAETLSRQETHPAPANAAYDICDQHRFCDPLAQTLYEGTVSPQMKAIDEHFLTRSRIRVYGGTTNCWGGWTRTLTPEDFDRTDLDPLMKWPITRGDLERFYAVAQQYCSLPRFEPFRYDQPEWWTDKADRPLEVLRPLTGNTQTVVWTEMNGKGPATPDGSLDFQLVWGPSTFRDPNTTLVRNANVRALIRNSANAITHAGCTTLNYDTRQPGNSFTVQARQFVVAAGGIETPRLLLQSRLNGPGDTLGRYFMVHPLNVSAVTFTGKPAQERVRNFYSWPWPVLRSQPYPPKIFAAITPTAQALRSHGIGNIRALLGLNGWGGGGLNLNWEQVPAAGNRVRLSTEPGDVDLFGDPRVVLDWSLNALDARTLDKGAHLVIEELRRHQLIEGQPDLDLRVRQPGDHHMGTTRMSTTPATGYVDANCRVHHLRNLFVASSSVFPTGGYANPTLTIIALAVRLAAHLTGRTTELSEPLLEEAVGV